MRVMSAVLGDEGIENVIVELKNLVFLPLSH